MSKIKTGMGTTVEIAGFEICSISKIEVVIEQDIICASITVPLESIEIVDGKQLVKLAGELVKVDE